MFKAWSAWASETVDAAAWGAVVFERVVRQAKDCIISRNLCESVWCSDASCFGSPIIQALFSVCCRCKETSARKVAQSKMTVRNVAVRRGMSVVVGQLLEPGSIAKMEISLVPAWAPSPVVATAYAVASHDGGDKRQIFPLISLISLSNCS